MALRKSVWATTFLAFMSVSPAWSTEASPITKERLRAAISKELRAGAPPTDIEAFFKRHKISFGWNRFDGRYDGVIRDVEPFHGITIRVFVDKDRRFLSSEIVDAFTAP